MQVKKLYRVSDDKVFFGVCGGLAEYFDVDSLIIRLLFALSAILAGTGLLVYIVLAIVMPSEAKLKFQEEQASHYYNRAGAWQPYGAAPDAGAEGTDYWDSSSGEAAEAASDAGYGPGGEAAGNYQERRFYRDPESRYGFAGPQPAEARKERGKDGGRDFGVVLLGFGTLLLMKVLFPNLDSTLFFAIAFIALGIFLIVRKR